MTIFSILKRRGRTRFSASDAQRMSWLGDPLSHPDIEMMSERELGDLPLRPMARDIARELGACGA